MRLDVFYLRDPATGRWCAECRSLPDWPGVKARDLATAKQAADASLRGYVAQRLVVEHFEVPAVDLGNDLRIVA